MMSQRRGLKVLVLLLALPVFGAGVAFFWIRGAADRRWAAAQERIQQLVAAHPPIVQPLPSTAHSKEIQIHFVAAIKEAARGLGSERDAFAREYLARKMLVSRPDGEGVDSFLADVQEVLGRLHQGARRCAASPSEFPPGWRIDWDRITLRFIMHSCVIHARLSRSRKAPMEAAVTLLDSLQLARFWAASGKGENRIDSLSALYRPLQELGSILENEPLSREQLRSLERELEPLEAAIRRPMELLEPALAEWAEGLSSWDLTDLQGAPYRWRYILPRNLMKAEAFESCGRLLNLLVEGDRKSFSERMRDLERILREFETSKNPILLREGPFSHLLGLTPEERMAQFRLLRIAARYRATGEILKLRDPFGDEFVQSRTESRMKFWSLGSDGMDDRGDAGKDIVIEVEHPGPE